MRTPPLMLTDVLLSLQPRWWHLGMKLMGLPQDVFHSFLEGFCPCGALGDNEEEYELLEDGITLAILDEHFPVVAA